MRQNLIEEIKDVARGQIDENGPNGVSLRAVAREVGVSPATLYTYFDSLDALVLAVVTDHFDDLADAVTTAVEAVPPNDLGGRLYAGISAYRRWALERPGAFSLLFFRTGEDIYCEPGGPVLTASLRVFVPMLAVLVEGWASGAIAPAPPGPPVDTTSLVDTFGLDITPDQLREACGLWALFHGLVALELGGHVTGEWLDPDQLFDSAVRGRLRELGLDA
jgi:AcrR family transcriptional regulator